MSLALPDFLLSSVMIYEDINCYLQFSAETNTELIFKSVLIASVYLQAVMFGLQTTIRRKEARPIEFKWPLMVLTLLQVWTAVFKTRTVLYDFGVEYAEHLWTSPKTKRICITSTTVDFMLAAGNLGRLYAELGEEAMSRISKDEAGL